MSQITVTELKALVRKGGTKIVLSSPVSVQIKGQPPMTAVLSAPTEKVGMLSALNALPKSALIEVDQFDNVVIIKAAG